MKSLTKTEFLVDQPTDKNGKSTHDWDANIDAYLKFPEKFVNPFTFYIGFNQVSAYLVDFN